MAPFARASFKNVTEPLAIPPEIIEGALAGNRRALLGWLDRYLIALQDMRDMLAQHSGPGSANNPLLSTLAEAHDTRGAWMVESSISGDEKHAQLRADLREDINEARPGRTFMGGYLADRVFRKKEK
jgi:hypothetical protein